MLLSALAGACSRRRPERVRRIVYWEKWGGFEGAAMEAVVQLFNREQRDRAAREPGYVPIEVERVTISTIEYKLLVAIAGKNPPDVAGSYGYLVASHADKGALVDLTPRLERAGIRRSNYIERFFDLCTHRGKVWALPTTPACVALHWNKRLFRDAGLDPERPPRTIEEMDAFSERLTVWEVTTPRGERKIVRGFARDVPSSRKRLLQLGFIHTNPPWWPYGWGNYFGGKLVEGERVTTDSPDNVRAFEWIASCVRRIGVDAMQRFSSGFGRFGSPQNPFLAGKLAMQLQGVWMFNYIQKYAPGMQWGAAPFPHPADRPELRNTTLIETDTLCIPRDSQHPDEAFEFIRFVSQQRVMEELCLGQRKFSPLRDVSDGFWKRHPHPHIRMFRELALSPNAFTSAKVGVWYEYVREMRAAVDIIDNLTESPRAVLGEVRRRMQASLDRELRSLERRGLR